MSACISLSLWMFYIDCLVLIVVFFCAFALSRVWLLGGVDRICEDISVTL